MSDDRCKEVEPMSAESQAKAEKIQKVRESMETLVESLKKLETNLRSLQKSALLLRQVVDKFQQLTPEQRAKVTQIIQQMLRPTDTLNNFFISSTLH